MRRLRVPTTSPNLPVQVELVPVQIRRMLVDEERLPGHRSALPVEVSGVTRPGSSCDEGASASAGRHSPVVSPWDE